MAGRGFAFVEGRGGWSQFKPQHGKSVVFFYFLSVYLGMFQSRERVMTGMMYTRLGRLAILYRHNLGNKALLDDHIQHINKNKIGRRNGGPFKTEFMG
jgi:hypothetical protein